MNVLEITESLKDLSDQELVTAQAPEIFKQTEIKRRMDVRNRHLARQAEVDATKTVSEKQMEDFMGTGIVGADPTTIDQAMGQEVDPALQQGIAGEMMYGGGILGFDEGGHVHPHPEEELTEDEVVEAINDPSIPDEVKEAVVEQADSGILSTLKAIDDRLGITGPSSAFRELSEQSIAEGSGPIMGGSGGLGFIGPGGVAKGGQYALNLMPRLRAIATRNPGSAVRTTGTSVAPRGGANVAGQGGRAVERADDVILGGPGTATPRLRVISETANTGARTPGTGLMTLDKTTPWWKQALGYGSAMAAGIGTEMAAEPHRIPDPRDYDGTYEEWSRERTMVNNQRRRQREGAQAAYQNYKDNFDRRYDDEPVTFNQWLYTDEGKEHQKSFGEMVGGAGRDQEIFAGIFSEEDWLHARERPDNYRMPNYLDERRGAGSRTQAIAQGEEDPNQESVANALRNRFTDVFDQARAGFDDQMGYLDMGLGLVGDYRRRVQDDTMYRPVWDEEQRAGTEALVRAGELRDLNTAREEEQTELLARELGMSEDRIRELIGEMDTPEEIQARKDAEFWSEFGAVAGGNPRDYAAGWKTVQDAQATLDDTLRSERKTALKDIYDQRKEALSAERTGRTAIHNTRRTGLTEWDAAKDQFDAIGSRILREQANLNVAGEKDAMLAYVELLKQKAIQTGAYNAQIASTTAAMEQAIATRENPFADPKVMEAMRNELDDLINTADTPEQQVAVEALEKIFHAASTSSISQAAMAHLGGDPAGSPVTEYRTTNQDRDSTTRTLDQRR